MENKDKARDDLQDILHDREYQIYYEDNRSFIEIWWDKLIEWFRELLSNWFSSLNPSNGFAELVLIIIIGTVILLTAVGSILFLRSMKRKRAFQNHRPLQSMNELEWSVTKHLLEADKQEKADNYAAATRHIFLALLLHFHENNWLIARVWKTNWEYYDELQQTDPTRAKAFYKLANMFDEVVYGERTIKGHEYTEYRKEALTWLNRSSEEAKLGTSMKEG
ncbi:DUF4129 domain-containing protein [Ornithinibacillus salinisoli]|uniref:DUF4129 domain-containing protein n=1 Tax=Ornithinibacillus salinisoli TaxID=1848459 RepID=A0ABW4VVK6_9BACI